MRRVSGYNLDEFDGNGSFDMARFVVGSEGTLLTITEAKVRVVPIPAHKALAVLHFHDLLESMEATVATLEVEPAAVEMIGSMILRQARANLEYSRMMDFVEGDPEALLVVEVTGDSEAEVTAGLDRLEAKMKRAGLGYAVRRVVDPAAQARVWAVRKAGLGLMMNVQGPAKPLPFVEDTAVAPEKLPEFVRRFDQIVQDHGTSAGYYGHASVGCLHIRPLIDLKRRDGVERMVSISEAISDLVLEFGGAMSAEHGDGLVRSGFIEKMFGPRITEAFADVKSGVRSEGHHEPGQDRRPTADDPGPADQPRLLCVEDRDSSRFRARGRHGRRRRDVQRPGGVPQGARRDHVPVVHGDPRRGALDPGTGERAPSGDVGPAGTGGDDIQAALRGDGPVPRLQGVQGGVPIQRRHGQAQVRVPEHVPQGQRPDAAKPDVRQHRHAQQVGVVLRPAVQPGASERSSEGAAGKAGNRPEAGHARVRRPDLQAMVQGARRLPEPAGAAAGWRSSRTRSPTTTIPR